MKSFLPALLALLLCAGASPAQEPLGPPAATLRIQTTSVAVGVGLSWGRGTLLYRDKEYAFEVSGLSLAAVGISRVRAEGGVWFLDKLEDFEGEYTGVDVGLAVGAGGGGVALRNRKGVYVKLRSLQQGVRISAATEGATFRLVAPQPEPKPEPDPE